MLKRLLLAAALAAGFASPALAQQQWPGATLYDNRGQPLGTAANPLNVTGNSGGGSSPSSPTYTTPAGITRSRLTCTLPKYSDGGNVVCTNEAGTQTTTACAANTACLISGANANRKTALFMTRTNGVTVDIGYSPTVAPGNAVGIDGPGAAGGQGGATEESPAHVGAYYAASPSAGAVLVFVQGQ